MLMPSVPRAFRSYAQHRKNADPTASAHRLLVGRSGRVVAALASSDVSDVLGNAGIAGTMLGADSLALVVEGVFPIVPENPVTGSPWEGGEAEQLWRESDGVARGWVTEAAIIAYASRDQALAHEVWDFTIDGDAVRWGGEPLSVNVGGLAERLALELERPAADPARVPDPGEGMVGDAVDGPFYSSDRGRMSLDIGCIRALGNRMPEGDVVLVLPSREDADRMIVEGLPSWHAEVYAG